MTEHKTDIHSVAHHGSVTQNDVPKEPKERTVADVMNELEKSVKSAQSLETVAVGKEKEAATARNEASDAVNKVADLKNELNEKLGNIFPTSTRVRIAS